jgi:hypothetical protein
MKRTRTLVIGVSLAVLAVGLAASPVSAVQDQNPASVDVGTNCECLDGGGGDDDDGGGGGGHLEPSLDDGFLFELDSGGGGGGDDGGGGSGGHLEP